ncbi:DNA repair protein endonuclease SAE2/CtIP C-terminus-domain-containing protein [Ampelomyces quisqualis]|uniref:DNA repair protein endonuclease SAE2/CtIP C-terminus-domain-containing protein n=1 Tax=Ampelomyces quisqualis TaxID=50730 RepID=A0A6A5QRI9_AMPQU|nr:DNA repair protein endonuclease SAE2/CtIP C-terminus-domain-containing protein [Ampelomyces quisqualis]
MSDLSTWIEKSRDLWKRVYDEVIAPDLEEEWRRRDAAHAKDLKHNEEIQQSMKNHVQELVLKNSCLASENEQLKQHLELSYKNASSNLSAVPQPGETTSGATDEPSKSVHTYDELSKKYQDLLQRVKYLERKNQAVMLKNKEMKECVRAWQEYADRQSGKQKQKNEAKAGNDRPRLSAIPLIEDSRPYMPPSPRSIATIRTPLLDADTERSSPAPIASLADAESEHGVVTISPEPGENHEIAGLGSRNGSVTPKPPTYGRSSLQHTASNEVFPLNVPSSAILDGDASKHLQSYFRGANPGSSQTTVDENTEQSAKQTDLSMLVDDDEMPQFLSARSLKRKRGPSSRFDIYGDRSSDGTPVKPFRVKEEQLSSPPNIHTLMRKETIDLDDPASTLLQTPRHSKSKPAVNSISTGAARHQRSSSAPFSQAMKLDQPRPLLFPEVSALRSDLGIPGEAVDVESRSRSEPSNPRDTVPEVLHHLDPNAVVNPDQERTRKRVKRAEVRKADKHAFLSESGEDPPPTDENASRLAPGLARAKINQRLHDHSGSEPAQIHGYQAKTTPSTTKVKVELSSTPPDASHVTQDPIVGAKQHNQREAVARPVERDQVVTEDRPQWSMKAAQPRRSGRKSPVSTPKQQRAIRSKPLAQLTLQDFKPNPAYNQGYSYAFSEAVRKRGERMCLPGCTNPQCCGSTFRTLAEAQAPLTSSQEEELLEDYLGEAYDNMSLTQMKSEERQELILQARTRKIAKEAGKHREAYERRRTPPGFWRVDFPTTQEQQEDREKSKEQVKKVVQERWLEANRKGGKWIFRDE